MTYYNILMFLMMVAAVILAVYLFVKPDSDLSLEDDSEEDKLSFDYLFNLVREEYNHYMQLNVTELNLNRAQCAKVEEDKHRLRRASKTCFLGDLTAKQYVKTMLQQFLLEQSEINESNIDHSLKLDNLSTLSTIDKFHLLLYSYSKIYHDQGFSKLMETHNLMEPIGQGFQMRYIVTAQQIDNCFEILQDVLLESLTYEDKLSLLIQLIYQDFLGNGVIDELRDQNIDSIRCGTSGAPYRKNMNLQEFKSDVKGSLPAVSFNSVNITLAGKEVYLAFLGYEDELKFVRVAKRIYKYNCRHILTEENGTILSHGVDGSRVVVARPPNADSWGFFIRKHSTGDNKTIEELVTDKNSELVLNFIRWAVIGCLNIMFTGAQNTGKTTFMKKAVGWIRHSFPIRTFENEFEMDLRVAYPDRDIYCLCETDTVTGQELIDIQKKMDGAVLLISEVADAATAKLAIQNCEVGGRQFMSTHHADESAALVRSLAGNSNDLYTLALVSSLIHLDVHWVKTPTGKRYIERITTIVPHVDEDYSNNLEEAQKEYYYRQTDRQIFETEDLIVWENGTYKAVNVINDRIKGIILSNLLDDEKSSFLEFCEKLEKEVLY